MNHLNYFLNFFVPAKALAVSDSLVGDCDNCGLPDFWKLLANIFNYLLVLVVPLAILGIGVGGVYMILGSANEQMRSRGKEILWSSIIGLVIAVAAWVIINTILKGLGATGITNPLK